MDLITSVIMDMWQLFGSMSPFILLGFLLSGLLHEFMPRNFYSKFLAKDNTKSVFMAALLGIPLPLCSCGVIPTAMGLRREGASKGATVSFLIATPQTGIDSIIATYSLMGLPFALVRPLVALCTAVMGGCLVNQTTAEVEDKHSECCTADHNHDNSTWTKRLMRALRFGLVDMVDDIGKWLIAGLILAGLITAAVPEEWFAIFKDNSLASMFAVLLLSIPMYLCATGSIPIAVALMLKGLSPGAALVLLMAGPASNMASILVIRKVLGLRTMLLYLLTIVAGAFCFGLIIDLFLPREWFTQGLINLNACCTGESSSWLQTGGAIILGILLVYARVINKVCHHSTCHCHDKQAEACAVNTSRTLSIRGMHCHHCAANVQQTLERTHGIAHAEVNLEGEKAIVQGNDYSPEEVIRAIEELGFDAEWLS